MNERMLDFEKWMTAATDKIDSLSSAIEDLESQMEKMKIDAREEAVVPVDEMNP